MTISAASKTKPSKGLGKGLSALMSESYSQNLSSSAPIAAPVAPNVAGVTQMPVSQMMAGPYQPRRQFSDEYLHELADSIEKNGIVQPILVREHPAQAGHYEIIAGERRFRAAKLAKLSHVPVLVREVSDQQALEMALIENIQRQDLNPLEEAMGYQRLMDEFDYTQEQLAIAVGKSRSHIANLLRLQSLPESIKVLIDKGQLSAGHARALLGCEHAETLAERAVREGLSVRQIEQFVKSGALSTDTASRASSAPRNQSPYHRNGSESARQEKNGDILALEEMLSANLGLKVSIDSTGNQSGEVVIAYSSLAQLDEILRRLGGSI